MIEFGLGFGSNMGDKAGHIFRALQALEASKQVKNFRLSGLYRTAPWGNVDQDWFVNACGVGETALGAHELLALVQAIELKMGRERIIHWGPRNIDIDVLYYGDTRVDLPDLTVPHVELLNRAFVLVPLLELRPNLELGGVQLSEAVKELDASEVIKLS